MTGKNPENPLFLPEKTFFYPQNGPESVEFIAELWSCPDKEIYDQADLPSASAESGNLGCMERICSQCRAVLGEKTVADWCPACGGALIERATLPGEDHPALAPPQVDHRGIVLPRRHALGGIITPQ